jgi:hypothetical protein
LSTYKKYDKTLIFEVLTTQWETEVSRQFQYNLINAMLKGVQGSMGKLKMEQQGKEGTICLVLVEGTSLTPYQNACRFSHPSPGKEWACFFRGTGKAANSKRGMKSPQC